MPDEIDADWPTHELSAVEVAHRSDKLLEGNKYRNLTAVRDSHGRRARREACLILCVEADARAL